MLGSGTYEFTGIAVTIDVFAIGDASAARGIIRIRQTTATPTGSTAEVRCLRVEGRRALVEGVITQTSFPGELGRTTTLVIEDRGVFGSPRRDALFLGLGDAGAANCRLSPSVYQPWLELSSGDYLFAGNL